MDAVLPTLSVPSDVGVGAGSGVLFASLVAQYSLALCLNSSLVEVLRGPGRAVDVGRVLEKSRNRCSRLCLCVSVAVGGIAVGLASSDAQNSFTSARAYLADSSVCASR